MSTAPAPKEVLPAYLIVGDDPHLTSEALQKLVEGKDSSSVNEFGATDEFDSIVQAIVTPSMFGDRRTIVVHDVDKFAAELQRQLIGYLDSPVPDATLILIGAKMPSQMLVAGRKSGHVLDVAKGKKSDLLLWLKHELAAKGLDAGGDAMNALLEAVGEQRLALSQAVEELSLAMPGGGRVTPKQITRQFQSRSDVKLFGFIDAVAERHQSVALETLHHLMGQGEPVQMLFWTLTRHFRMLLIAAEANAVEVGRELGIQPWRAEKLVRQARGFKRGALLEAYQLLAEADVKMKKSEEPESLTLERAVVAISRPTPRQRS
jgi:DNA polymerase III subunit delta